MEGLQGASDLCWVESKIQVATHTHPKKEVATQTLNYPTA
jgi:hypothetical protein